MTVDGSYDAANVAITGGSINATTIGNSNPNPATVTTLSVTGNSTLGDAASDTVTVAGTTVFNADARFTTFLRTPAQAVTIASDTITATASWMQVDTEGGAATDNLSTINGAPGSGTILIITTTNSARDVTLKDGTGNLQLSGDCVLDNVQDVAVLMSLSSSVWLGISCSNNS